MMGMQVKKYVLSFLLKAMPCPAITALRLRGLWFNQLRPFDYMLQSTE
jgi:hypothetical protein